VSIFCLSAHLRRPRGRFIALLATLGIALLAGVSRPARTQATPPRDSVTRDSTARAAGASTDSIMARLERAEAAVRLLREQMTMESAAQVRMRSRVQLELSARLIVNSSRSTGSLSNTELPVFATPPRPRDAQRGSPGSTAFGVSMRQSLLGATVTLDSVLGATLAADLELDFFARGLDASPPLFPEPRLRTARLFLTWPRTELLVGSESPLISDLNPISAAGVAIPVFSTAGNLWNWLPQVRLTREVWRGVERWPLSVAVQGAILTPVVSERHVTTTTGPDAGTLSGQPALEGRVRLRWGSEHETVAAQAVLPRGGELGVGAHHGAMRVSGDSATRVWAVSADARVALGHHIELRGEAYRGRALRGLGGGSIGQTFGSSTVAGDIGVPLTDTAGWLQLNAQLHPGVMAGAGCGTDRVHDTQAERKRNTVCATHVMWRPVQPLLLSLEYRDLRTRTSAGLSRGGHFNLGLGVEL
jgi:hypothetical protein